MRNLHEPHAPLDQPPGQQTTLAEFPSVTLPQVRRLIIKLKATVELRTGQFQTLIDRRVIIS